MSGQRDDCGCVRTPCPDLERVVWWHPCRGHNIALHAFFTLHWPGHEDCCDLPIIRNNMQQQGWTVDDLEYALPFVRENERDYARTLVNRLREERT